MQPLNIKEKAILYRRQGCSYNMISEKLGLAKSTLSDWLHDIPYQPNKNVLKRISLNNKRAGNFKRKQKIDSIRKMKQLSRIELGKLTKRDLWFMGIGLYLGEGSKSQETVQISNSDPNIINIIIEWLKETVHIDSSNLNIAIHTYPDNDIDETIDFWSKITGVPKNQFGKTQIDTRTNKSKNKEGKLPYGTARLTIRSHGDKKFGVNLHRRIMGWIESSTEQINAKK